MEKTPFVRTTQGTAHPQNTPTNGSSPDAPTGWTPHSRQPVSSKGTPSAAPVETAVLRGTLRTGSAPTLPAAVPVAATVQSDSFRRSAGSTGSAAGQTGAADRRGVFPAPAGQDSRRTAQAVAAPSQALQSSSAPSPRSGPPRVIASNGALTQNLAAAFAAAEQARVAAEQKIALSAPDNTVSHAPNEETGQTLTAAFAAAERARLAAASADEEQSGNPTGAPSVAGSGSGVRNLASAFAAAERTRLTAEAANEAAEETNLPSAAHTRNRPAPDRCTDAPAPDYPALDSALQRGIGWGSEAGSTLTNSSASAMLLDWGEDNRAAHQSQRALTAHIRTWVQQLDCCAEQNLRENWPRIARHADELVRSTLPSAGRLMDAGSPNRRTDYSPVHWAAVKQAMEQALNGGFGD